MDGFAGKTHPPGPSRPPAAHHPARPARTGRLTPPEAHQARFGPFNPHVRPRFIA
jgi:hypothetical protein